MKIKYLILSLLISVACLILCGFTIDTTSSVKTLTRPYITTYECTHATLENFDLIKGFDYFKITLLNKNELEIKYKEHDGRTYSRKYAYRYDEKSGTLYADNGILSKRAIIENGKLTLSTAIDGKQLIIRFSS